MEKPIQLIIEDSKNNIVNFINKECSDNKIDYCFLEIILKDIYQEILSKKEIELQELREQYKNSLENKKGSD